MRTKSEISIEESDSSMLNEKRRLALRHNRLDGECPPYAEETKPLRIHTIINEYTTNVNGYLIVYGRMAECRHSMALVSGQLSMWA